MGEVSVTYQLGAAHIDIATAGGIVIARHRLAAEGSGVMVRDHGHVHALDTEAMATANTGGPPHRRKQRIPPGKNALAAADLLLNNNSHTFAATAESATVIDMSAYERAAQNRTTLR